MEIILTGESYTGESYKVILDISHPYTIKVSPYNNKTHINPGKMKLVGHREEGPYFKEYREDAHYTVQESPEEIEQIIKNIQFNNAFEDKLNEAL